MKKREDEYEEIIEQLQIAQETRFVSNEDEKRHPKKIQL